MSEPEHLYASKLTRAMTLLGEDPRTVFLGQGVRYDCHRMWPTLAGVPMDKRIEMPVAEDFQMGFSTGLALTGKIPVTIYPRWDFLLLAANQLINHLDKCHLWGWNPKVIIRVAVGATQPLNPGPQHSQDHTEAFRKMLTYVHIIKLDKAEHIVANYALALAVERPVIVVERMECY